MQRGASKVSDKCSFAKVVETERVDATGGASSSPTKSEGDSANAKQTERSLKGKGDGDFRGIVRFWKGWFKRRMEVRQSLW